MKISKKQHNIESCEQLNSCDAPVLAVAPDNGSVYQCAVDKIMEAIECLGSIAKTDVKARESIANLSVVLFDLKC